MKRFSNIQQLLSAITKNDNWIHSEHGRNISELIKLIPLIGSTINANTLEKIRDEKLEQRLYELEKISAEALQREDVEFLYKIVEENRIILYNFIAHYQNQIFKNNPELKKTVSSYLAIPEEKGSFFEPNPEFKFVVISGASASGKDVQLDELYSKSLKRFHRVDILRKLTTRKKRVVDSEYNLFKTRLQFKKLVKEGKVLFPYEKREHLYGFDKQQFIDEASTSTLLLCVFTEFGVIPKAKKFLDEQGIDSTFILFEAPLKDLVKRSYRRQFHLPEIKRRIKSVEYDLEFIAQNDELINSIYDYRVPTGDNNSVKGITNRLIEIIEEETQYKTKRRRR